MGCAFFLRFIAPEAPSLWAGFGGWRRTKVKDVQFETEFGSIIRELIATDKGSQNYFTRLALADNIYFDRLSKGTP